MTKSWLQSLVLVACASLLVGCTTEDSAPATDDDYGPTYNGPAESAYCSNVQTFTPYIEVTGTAQFIRRNSWGNYTSGGLGGSSITYNATTNPNPASAHPIRYAEIRVTDGSGAVVQCGETRVDGTFTVRLPTGNTNYTLSINSRSFNNMLRASVLNRVEQNRFYSLSSTVNASADINLQTLTAPADGTVLGAAFNILDQMLDANIFLRAKGNCNTAGYANCSNFTVAPKASVYWEKGFNPNSYFGGNAGLSFYLPGYFRLFILGGRNGDVNSSDTDHFDQSVILHEYGHFLEDAELASDSPGGPHDGNGVIDPRLAWSEGWGNFFQAAVLNYIAGLNGQSYSPRYIDTFGNDDGMTDLLYFADLENQIAGNDVPNQFGAVGEGNFREFSVSRLLWDAVDTATDSGADSISDQFVNIWAVLKKTSRGFKDSNFAFRNIGLFHMAQVYSDVNESGQTWTSLRTLENHRADQTEYGQYVVTTSSCASLPYSIDPIADSSTALSASNLFRNNRFYYVKLPAGNHTILLTYQTRDTGAPGYGPEQEPDLDLYLYNESARFANSNDIVKYAISDADGNESTQEAETITFSASAGNYLINVNAYTSPVVGSITDFSLTLNGSPLCPGNIIP